MQKSVLDQLRQGWAGCPGPATALDIVAEAEVPSLPSSGLLPCLLSLTWVSWFHLYWNLFCASFVPHDLRCVSDGLSEGSLVYELHSVAEESWDGLVPCARLAPLGWALTWELSVFRFQIAVSWCSWRWCVVCDGNRCQFKTLGLAKYSCGHFLKNHWRGRSLSLKMERCRWLTAVTWRRQGGESQIQGTIRKHCIEVVSGFQKKTKRGGSSACDLLSSTQADRVCWAGAQWCVEDLRYLWHLGSIKT